MTGKLLAGLVLAWSASHAAFKFFDPRLGEPFPATVSELGLYSDIQAKILDTAATRYDVNTEFWLDHSVAERLVVLPPGTQIAFSDTSDRYGFPAGAVVIKNLWMDTIEGNPSSRILIQTMALVRSNHPNRDIWTAFTYKWDKTQSEGYRVPGKLDTVLNIRPRGGGAPFQRKWVYLDSNNCKTCHRTEYLPSHGRRLLGFFTAQLNRPLKANPSVNQLQHFFDKGLIKKPEVLPDYAKLPRWAAVGDQGASLDHRARSYIAANCSGCHGRRGIDNGAVFWSELSFDYYNTASPGIASFQIETHDPERDFGMPGAALVVAKDPDKSILRWRQMQRNKAPGDFDNLPDQMPRVGTYEVDTAAMALLAEWINAMEPNAIRPYAHKTAPGAVRWGHGGLWLPAHPRRVLPDHVTIADFQGRKTTLPSRGGGFYRGPHPLPARAYRVVKEE